MAYYKNTIGPTVQFQNGLNAFNKGSGYGAAAGSKFGPWGTLIGAVVGGTVGIFTSYFNNKLAYKQGKAQLRAAETANKATLALGARNLNEIARQRTILSMETQNALLYALQQGRAQDSSVAALYAAADQVGNQALYQQSAIQNVVDEQQYQSIFNLLTQQLNLNVQVQNLMNRAKDSFVGVNVLGGDFSWSLALSDIMGSGMAMVLGGAMQNSGKQAYSLKGDYTPSSSVFYDINAGGYVNTPKSNGFTNYWLNSAGTGSRVNGIYGGNFSRQFSSLVGL